MRFPGPLFAILCLVQVNLPIPKNSVGQPLEFGPRSAGLNGATTALRDQTAGTANPASYDGSTFIAVSASRAYGLPELDLVRFAAGRMIGPVGVAAGVDVFGFDEYRRQTFYSDVSTYFSDDRLALGVRAAFTTIRIEQYGRLRLTSLTIGAIAKVVEQATFAVSAHNLFRTGPPTADSMRMISFGAAVRLPGDVHWSVDFIQRSDRQSIRSGMEIRILRAAALRFGVSPSPATFATGVGIRASPIHAEVAGQWHAELGFSPVVGLSIRKVRQ